MPIYPMAQIEYILFPSILSTYLGMTIYEHIVSVTSISIYMDIPTQISGYPYMEKIGSLPRYPYMELVDVSTSDLTDSI